MWDFRLNKTQRELYILESLFIYKKEITVSDLAAILDCNIKTITQALDGLNTWETLPKIHYVDMTSRIYVENLGTFYAPQIYELLYENTLDFEVLETIALHPYRTVEELSQDIHVSTSTLKRIVQNLNHNLNKYDIEIGSPLLRLEGNEMQVSNFLINYFYERRTLSTFPEFVNFKEATFSLFQKLVDFTGMHHHTSMYYTFSWTVFVTFLRLRNEFHIKSPYKAPPEIHEFFRINYHLNALRELERIFSISFKDESVIDELWEMIITEMDSEIIIESDRIQFVDMVEAMAVEFSVDVSAERIDEIGSIVYSRYLNIKGATFFLFNFYDYYWRSHLLYYPKSTRKISEIIVGIFDERIKEDAMRPLYIFYALVRYYPELFIILGDYENKIDINLFLVVNETMRAKIVGTFRRQMATYANFNVVEPNRLFELENLNNAYWITDTLSIKHPNVLTINAALVFDETVRIIEFIKEIRIREGYQ